VKDAVPSGSNGGSVKRCRQTSSSPPVIFWPETFLTRTVLIVAGLQLESIASASDVANVAKPVFVRRGELMGEQI
jgi:hypothetical protein